ncbi:MAG: hypothetical protein H7Z41_07470 [Cytophagales bacterium]|nr:hypothetical protein [Armatimonadota bacterium]
MNHSLRFALRPTTLILFSALALAAPRPAQAQATPAPVAPVAPVKPVPPTAKAVAVPPPYAAVPDPKPGTVLAPVFVADTSEVPELQTWGYVAESLCQTWYPKVSAILGADDRKRKPLSRVTIFFKKDMKGVAYANGSDLYIAADWVKAHPDDYGMVIHELTHLVQRYPSYQASWLVEGIADYVRGHYFESATPMRPINFDKAKYTDAYKTTAAFLIWVDENRKKGAVQELSIALSAGTYTDALWKQVTGKDAPTLWEEFAAATKAAKPAVSASTAPPQLR